MHAALRAAELERANIDSVQGAARRAVIVASVLTVATFVAAVTVPADDSGTRASLLLSDAGRQAAAALCDREQTTIKGRLELDTLSRPFVTIETEPNSCRADHIMLRLRRDHVLSVAVP